MIKAKGGILDMSENLILLVYLIIILILFFIIRYHRTQKKKGIIKSTPFKHIDGIKSLSNGIDVNISFNENSVSIDNITYKLSSIKSLEINSSKELVDKENNVISRAVIGSIFGGVGAIVGGMSGINNGGKETRLMHYLIMNFYDGSKAIFQFKNDNDKNSLNGVIQKINSY